MQIQTSTVFHIGGATFDSEAKARQWLADQVGRIIDKALSDAGAVTGPKTALQVNAAMLSNAAVLAVLLSAYAAPVSD